jgi:hypothetical protein
MKWPKDNKERVKMLVLIGMGVAVVIYLVIAGAVNPILTKRKYYKTEINRIKGYLVQARKKIKHTAQDQEDNYATILEIKKMTDNHLLKPQLGMSYLLSAKETLEEHAVAVGMSEKPSVREVGIVELPKPTGKPNYAFKSYTAGVTMNCGLNDLIKYLKQIEEANPYACISRLSILTQSRTPGEHRVTFEIQWPVWANSEDEQTLELQLKEVEEARLEAAKMQANQTGEEGEGSVTNAPDTETESAPEQGE